MLSPIEENTNYCMVIIYRKGVVYDGNSSAETTSPATAVLLLLLSVFYIKKLVLAVVKRYH